MKNTTKFLSGAIAAVCCLPVAADNHEGGEAYHLAIHQVHAKLGHIPEFRAGMEALANCLAENESDDGFSVWRTFNGDRTEFHLVDRFDSWAEMDEDNPASDACWGNDEIRKGVFDHMASWETSYATKMPEWSRVTEGSTVVHLHNFRISEGNNFRAVVGEIMGYMEEAEYEHQPEWYNVMPGGYWQADMFAVSHYANFAAMDEDRPGVMGVLNEQVGEQRADQLWDAWGDAMEDQMGYWRQTLVLQPSMGYSPEGE